ncbi:MAG: hypothetical protein KGL90_06335 [Burkholderiales bacterium]|nr:hypothetical protein [Burkholderiales bacterium]
MDANQADPEGWDRWFFGGTPGPFDADTTPSQVTPPSPLTLNRPASAQIVHALWALLAMAALVVLAADFYSVVAGTMPQGKLQREIDRIRASCQMIAMDAERTPCK